MAQACGLHQRIMNDWQSAWGAVPTVIVPRETALGPSMRMAEDVEARIRLFIEKPGLGQPASIDRFQNLRAGSGWRQRVWHLPKSSR